MVDFKSVKKDKDFYGLASVAACTNNSYPFHYMSLRGGHKTPRAYSKIYNYFYTLVGAVSQPHPTGAG